MGKTKGFRAWYYFRMGWSTYFAFIFAAINTLTVTYYLAIEKVPALMSIFPTFTLYVLIVSGLVIPILTLIGYAHFKSTGNASPLLRTAVRSSNLPSMCCFPVFK